MWQIIDDFYRHVDYPEYEIHEGTQGSRFELRNTRTNTRAPLFMDQPNANIFTVMDVVEEAIRVNKFVEKIEEVS